MTRDIGFFFYPSTEGYPLGYPQLEIHLYDDPTQRHYDPERADFVVAGLEGGRERLTISHGWHGPKSYRACLGRIMLHDRKGKVVEAFSFGGQLTIANQEGVTICTLVSDAPILDLVTPQNITTRLVSEFEALLARLQASWKQHPAAFFRKLAYLGPQTLFIAGLVSMAQAYEEIPRSARNGNIREEDHVVHEAIDVLKKQDLWPAEPASLEDLLASS